MVVVGNAVDGIAIRLDGDEAVHDRPQTVTVHRQDDLADFAVITFYQINFGVFGAALDACQIVFRFDLDALRGIFGGNTRAEVFRRVFHIFAGRQIDHALFDAVGKGFADVGIFIEQTGNAQDVALFILNLLFFLHRFQADNRARHDDRANQADRQHHNQRAAEAVFIEFLSHCCAPFCV